MNELKTKPAYVFLWVAVVNYGFRPASRALCFSYWAVTKSGTGTWDLGRGDPETEDLGTRGLGDVGTWGRGDVETRGRVNSGMWGRGDTFSKYRISEMGQHRQES